MTIKTYEYINTLMNDFYQYVSNNEMYVFASSFDGSEIDSENSKKEFLNKTLFGKRIDSSDILYMIRTNMWEAGTVYDEYSNETDLQTKNFYVISEHASPKGLYHIFKCISNNNNTPSIEKPIYGTDINLTNYIFYSTLDGYTWKYMYSITKEQYDKYTTPTLFPIIIDEDVSNNSVNGINNIVVKNQTNKGYFELVGEIETSEQNSSLRRIYLKTSSQDYLKFQIENFYEDYVIYIKSIDEATGELYTIINSGISDSVAYIEITGYDPLSFEILSDMNFHILPKIEIVGDGSGFVGIPVLNNGSITSITVLNEGTGYNEAIGRIVNPKHEFDPINSPSISEICELSVIISPENGHGNNSVKELFSTDILLLGSFLKTDENIPKHNSYMSVGLIQDPVVIANTASFDNRIGFSLNTSLELNNILSINDEVKQVNFKGKIHEIDDINKIIYVYEYNEAYNDSDGFFISNANNVSLSMPLNTPAGSFEVLEIHPINYINSTGKIYYFNKFGSIERTETSSEHFKFVLNFKE